MILDLGIPGIDAIKERRTSTVLEREHNEISTVEPTALITSTVGGTTPSQSHAGIPKVCPTCGRGEEHELWHLKLKLSRYSGKLYPPQVTGAWLEGFKAPVRKKKTAKVEKTVVQKAEEY